MPQMAPYNWLYLNLLFTFMLIIFITYMYTLNIYYYNLTSSNTMKKINTPLFMLKW